MPTPAAVETRISLILLLYRRLDLSEVIAAGQIIVSGDSGLARRFAASF